MKFVAEVDGDVVPVLPELDPAEVADPDTVVPKDDPEIESLMETCQ